MRSSKRSATVFGLAVVLLASLLSQGVAYTKPDQLQLLENFKQAMLARPQHSHWAAALASWTCPTAPDNTVGGTCDPCGQQVWGNWEHVSCRGKRVAYDKYEVPGDGTVTNIHITDYLIEGPIPLAELCPFTSLREFDVDGGSLTGTIPTGFATCFPGLWELDLSYNNLTGTVPPEIAQVKTLEEFKVEHNHLTGTIPPELGTLQLNWLRFADNKLVGTIPKEYANLTPELFQLTLDNNGLDGNPGFSGDLYPLSAMSMSNFNAANNPSLCGMVPVGLRWGHGFNFYNTRLGLPCAQEAASGWPDLSEVLP